MPQRHVCEVGARRPALRDLFNRACPVPGGRARPPDLVAGDEPDAPRVAGRHLDDELRRPDRRQRRERVRHGVLGDVEQRRVGPVELDVERLRRARHVEALRLGRVEDEQHARIGRDDGALHQAARARRVGVRDLDVDGLERAAVADEVEAAVDAERQRRRRGGCGGRLGAAAGEKDEGEQAEPHGRAAGEAGCYPTSFSATASETVAPSGVRRTRSGVTTTSPAAASAASSARLSTSRSRP